jgi:succinyl-diaminopimelate desuccinylase
MLFTNNYAANVIPDLSSANLNIRFGDDYTRKKLEEILKKEAAGFGDLSFEFIPSGEAYYCDNADLKAALSSAIEEISGISPDFSAAGGTSDGRFMVEHCDVIEFGVQDATIHSKNERVEIKDLRNLEKIYLSFLKKYFR